MESNQTYNRVALAEVRKELTARLIRTWSFTEDDLAPRSAYQLVILIHLLAGPELRRPTHRDVLHARTDIR